MDYLPLFFDLRGKHCLIVGGGAIATRKARLLNKAQACIHVVAPKIEQELSALVLASGGQLIDGEYHSELLQDKALVISATDIAEVNERVARECHALKLPVNVVDCPSLCSVIMPAIIDRSPLIIGVTSGGQAPVLARKIRTQLESSIPAAYGALAKLFSPFRKKIKKAFPDDDVRRRFWENTIDGSVAEKVFAGDLAGAEQELREKIDQQDVLRGGEVYLVGAGPGDPDLLTFKALRLMQKAEVVLYDRLVSEPILDMVRRDAERVYVGKKRDNHAVPQQEINQMLVDYALQGKRVLRLKGGDPFIFGRGGEEIDLLAANKVPFQVVPGITAASGCAAYSGIPLTHRDYSQSVRFITGHLKEDGDDHAWGEFVNPNQTLVFYMGLAGLSRICQKLIEHGKDPQTPAALIEKGTLPEQRIHKSTLTGLPEYVKQRKVSAPTLLIIGDVVSLHDTLNWYHPQA
ncbi:MAG: uroporphyrinogen-III C-methyltransferase [Alteromonadaceae bacterium]|nr:MAG: uroporphyrinogen-III C-methyltransferase [Alteromonadaceae bacterium]